MRFHFCGELDCPDWVLAEIATVSRLTSVKLKLMCGHVIQQLVSSDQALARIDLAKVAKLGADAKLTPADVRATCAALSFIVTSASKHATPADTLDSELQQLGMPRELAQALCREYTKHEASLQAVLRQRSLRTSRLRGSDWKVDVALPTCTSASDTTSTSSASTSAPEGAVCVRLTLHTDVLPEGAPGSGSFVDSLADSLGHESQGDGSMVRRDVEFACDPTTLRCLLHEMRSLQTQMAALEEAASGGTGVAATAGD